MKKLVLFIMCGVLALTLATGCDSEQVEDNKGNNQVQKNNEIEKGIYYCESTTSGITQRREITILDNKIETTKITETWNYDTNHEGVCSNRKYNTERLSKLKGVSINIECNDLKGTSEVLYDMNEIVDVKESDLVEQRYINSDGTFNIDKWKTFYEDMNYTCSIKE